MKFFTVFAIIACAPCQVVQQSPTNPSLSQPTSVSLVYSVDYKLSGGNNLKVSYRLGNTGAYTEHIESKDVGSINITGLTPDSEYEFLSEYSSGGTQAPLVKGRTRPLAPVSLRILSVAFSSITFEVIDTEFTTGYFDVNATAVGENPVLGICSRDAESCVIGNLVPLGNYTLSVRICPGEPRICSDAIVRINVTTVLGVISNVSVINVHPFNLSLNWTQPAPVLETMVLAVPLQTCALPTLQCTVRISDEIKYCVFTDMASNAEYNFSVEGCNLPEGSPNRVCTPVVYYVARTLPAAPRDLQVTEKTSSSAKVSWAAPEKNLRTVDNYRAIAISQATSKSTFCESKGSGKCGSFCYLYGLEGGTFYNLTVQACVVNAATKKTTCGESSTQVYFRSGVTYLDIPLIIIIVLIFMILFIPITLTFISGVRIKSD